MTDDERLRLAELCAWLDRKPPAGVRGEGTPWHAWFDGDEYLGWKGLDAVTADEKARQAADRRDVQMESGHA